MSRPAGVLAPQPRKPVLLIRRRLTDSRIRATSSRMDLFVLPLIAVQLGLGLLTEPSGSYLERAGRLFGAALPVGQKALNAAYQVRRNRTMLNRKPVRVDAENLFSLAFRPFFLLALAIPMYPALVDRGMHALGYGAGTLILGVAARVALGHTGRPLRASTAMMVAFVLLTLGALVRVLLPMGRGWLGVSVGLWLVAYGLFLVQYAPILLSPRPDS